jgi:hypothetical protein
MLSAQAAKGAAQLQSETTYTVAADQYLPIMGHRTWSRPWWGVTPASPFGGCDCPAGRVVFDQLRVGNDNPVARVGESLLYKKSNHREWRFEVRSRETGMDRARAEGSIGTVAPRNNTQSSAAIFNDLGEAGRIVVVGGAYSHHVNLLVWEGFADFYQRFSLRVPMK